jgi:hypothetical protein
VVEVSAGSRLDRQRPDEQPATLDVTDAQGRRCLALMGDLDLAGTTAIREPVLAELADPGRSPSTSPGLASSPASAPDFCSRSPSAPGHTAIWTSFFLRPVQPVGSWT